MAVLVYFYILQAGFTVRSFEENWENFEWDQDAHFEELWEKGEAASDSFSQSSLILEPDHFLCLFLIMGFINSVGLIFLLWDILENPKLKFLNLMLTGLSACLLITLFNLFLFSTALWKPITVDNGKGDIFTGEYEYDMEMLVNNKTVTFAILGYGAVTSFIFIFIAMMRSLGKNYLYEFFLNFCFINLIKV